uniref:mannan-binding lectin serine protease 2-like n=1 Tax=Pristiophorus japonicus TaxID=55135 RepID=UPI00398EA694
MPRGNAVPANTTPVVTPSSVQCLFDATFALYGCSSDGWPYSQEKVVGKERTSGGIAQKGRLLLWVLALLPAAFGFQLNDMFGEFQSPGFPAAYGDNIYQTWNICVPSGFAIKLYFSHFSLEPSYRCDYDYIKILMEDEVLAQLCSESSTDTEEAPGDKEFYSIGNNMTVIFRTDYSNEKNFTGFAAHFAAVDIDECDQTALKEPICDHHCHNYLGGYYCSCKLGYLLDYDNTICRVQCSGNIFTERSGEFSSPNYPMSYAKSSKCDYRIEVEDGFSIVLEFVESFDVESHPDVPCPYDALKITTPKKKYESFCGDQLPGNITTLSNTVDIIFSTDSSGENTGWKIQYTTTATPCPYPIVPERGQITPEKSQFVFKDKFNLTCDTGYEIMQDDKGLPSFIAICQKDGTWNKDMPECKLIDCAKPDELANGNFTYTSTPPETIYLSTVQIRVILLASTTEKKNGF